MVWHSIQAQPSESIDDDLQCQDNPASHSLPETLVKLYSETEPESPKEPVQSEEPSEQPAESLKEDVDPPETPAEPSKDPPAEVPEPGMLLFLPKRFGKDGQVRLLAQTLIMFLNLNFK